MAENYAAVCAYKRKHGNLDIPVSHKTDNGLHIGRWLRMQCELYEKGTLDPDRKSKLDLVGMKWKQTDPWEEKYSLLKKYYEEHGHTNIPSDYVCDGVWLYRWLLNRRRDSTVKAPKTLQYNR